MRQFLILAALFLIVAPISSRAQTLETRILASEGARTIARAAEQEAVKNGWKVAIAIVDANGELLLFHRMDDVQLASSDIAQAKARTAARFRRPTKALQEAVEGGRTVLMGIPGMLAMEGGVPIIVNGRVIGAVGVSGATSAQDVQAAEAGIAALTP